MPTHREIPVQTVVDAIDSLIASDNRTGKAGIVIDRAYPFNPQELAAALVFTDGRSWHSLLDHLRDLDGDAATVLHQSFKQDHGIIYFPGVRFIGPTCSYDQKDGDGG